MEGLTGVDNLGPKTGVVRDRLDTEGPTVEVTLNTSRVEEVEVSK